MREDDGLGHYVPILRRIIVLVAVIIAVPVILWTITIFVRTYVGPPRLPTFHQLVSTASINAPSPRTAAEGVVTTADATRGSAPIVEANASTDPADSTMPTGSTAGDRADQDPAAAGGSRGSVFPPSPLAASDGNTTGGALASAQPAGSTDGATESLSASQPLSGPIPLPRRRPREAEMRTAEFTPGNMPMPRRRPEAAGAPPGTAGETTGESPLGFIQNLFH
jgi:hypothetical protein